MDKVSSGPSPREALVPAVEWDAFIATVLRRAEHEALRWSSEIFHPAIRYQFQTAKRSKGQRIAMVAAAAGSRMDNSQILARAATVALLHEGTLIVDDIIDRSAWRRGEPSLQAKFGDLHAACVAANLNTAAWAMVDEDAEARRALRRLIRAVTEAEALQESLKHKPVSLETWREIALGDTGAMFRYALAMGLLETEGLPWFTPYVYLRHGLDDIEDELEGRVEDITEEVPTLQRACAGLAGAFAEMTGQLPLLVDASKRFDPFFAEMRALYQRLWELWRSSQP